MLRPILAYLFVFSLTIGVKAQIITSDPVFPTMDDEIILTYDATAGNGDLSGVIPVYAHTGVITNFSEDMSDWRHVVGNWGTADNDVLMDPLGNNLHQITINPSTFYDLEEGEFVECLAFVFRNSNGSIVGRESDGSDIYFCLYDNGFNAAFFQPVSSNFILNESDDLNFQIQSSSNAEITLYLNGNEVANVTDNMVLEHNELNLSAGAYEAIFEATDGIDTVMDTLNFIVQPPVIQVNPPLGVELGINYLTATSVILELFAPYKDYVYVIGDFNDWQFDLDYLMNQSPGGNTWWLQIDGLTPGEEYAFQYFVGEDNLRIADPYADKILDFWNDPWIDEDTYPNLKPYPEGQTSEIVSVLQTNQDAFDWSDDDFVRPPKEKLIVYELLIRDFVEAHDYQTLIDTLDYIQNLGITAIELMPVYEFEGNSSWGYNGSFFFAPDKYYGTKDDYKAFVNACHERGIAVIMDIALNHHFGQSPMVRLYFDASIPPYGQTTEESPWFNQVPMHDFNVGYDFNHLSPFTKQYAKRVLKYWVEEFHIDGYRMDLSKGFTQNYTVGNLAAWADYDQNRVDILSEYANSLWDLDEDIYFILEHFADNDEEIVLSDLGMMLWAFGNPSYKEASMGYTSDLNWNSYQARGWSNPHLVNSMETHDEERIMYENLNFGNSEGDYNIQNIVTALERMELAHCFLIPLPGPKMMYQFGELGYDYSINTCEDLSINPDCRVSPKPIRWDYFGMEQRLKLYKVVSALNKLKSSEEAFSTDNFIWDTGGFGKRLILEHPSMNVVIIGNFDTDNIEMIPGFPNTGTWHDYFTGASFEENNLNNAYLLEPGEYHIYTDVALEVPDLSTSIEEVMTFFNVEFTVYPNPVSETLNVNYLSKTGNPISFQIYDLNGRLLDSVVENPAVIGINTFSWSIDPEISVGIYTLQLVDGDSSSSQLIVIE